MATTGEEGAGAKPLTVAAALAEGRAAGVDRLDLQLLLARTLIRPRTWLIAHDDAELSASQAAAFSADLARRRAGEPLAYIVGSQEFHGLALNVDRRVLIPRPDTEVLVDWAIERIGSIRRKAATQAARRPRVLDLGTGSGAIALALKHACLQAELLATDASAAALQVAALNAERLGLAVAFAQGSWWGALAGHPARFDLIVGNPPYIAESDEHLSALGHEPLQALTPGGDGLASLRTIAAGAQAHLRPSAWLLLEHGHDQGPAVRALLASHGYEAVQTRLDLAGRERCTGGQASPAIG